MSLLDRILDFFGWKEYPAAPEIRRGVPFGLDAHINTEFLPWMKAAGFELVLLDITPDNLGVFRAAKEAGLTVLTNLFPERSDPPPPPRTLAENTERARSVLDTYGPYIDLLNVWNEPDLAKFNSETIEDLAEVTRMAWTECHVRAPRIKVLGPTLSSLGGSARDGWKDKTAVIRRLAALGLPLFNDLVSFHVYKSTPDQAMRYVEKMLRIYRAAGWTKKAVVSEYGFESDRLGERKQAVYLANLTSMLSKHPAIAGGVIYQLLDAPPRDLYGVRTEGGRAKAAAITLPQLLLKGRP